MTAAPLALRNIWREALIELSRRKLRTGLTLLGLIFGVGAIVAMQGVGEGSRLEALALVEELGLHNLIVRAVPQDTESLKEIRLRSLGLTHTAFADPTGLSPANVSTASEVARIAVAGALGRAEDEVLVADPIHGTDWLSA